jgi:hydroxymethylpyrimidine kinase/phosphomethylpyrimidine kinase/thiamine-phosphate diphosphorylase
MIKGLYLITDHNRDNRLVERVRAAVRGGVRIVQYRDKESSKLEQTRLANELAKLCYATETLFVINDSVELALACNADGVHLGQQDMTPAEARALLGPDKIIGISTRTLEQARKAEADGADYIAIGSLFPTGSKGDAKHVGVDRLREIRHAITTPLIAIGGINRSNIGEVVDAGADSVAVISAVMQNSDPAMASRELCLAFNRNITMPRGTVLTMAGSDSGGGAGIQADLKTITLLGSYGMSAITALTAQNSCGVSGIHPSPADFVAAQIDAVLTDFGADIIKTGMLFSAEIVQIVAKALRTFRLPAVIDPVMIAKGGAPLLKPEAIRALKEEIIPRAFLLTPNLPEAEALVGFPVRNEKEMGKAAIRLQKMGARYVLIKGGHLPSSAVDLLLTDKELHRFTSERFETRHTHGTGCSYAAAIATFLAQGEPIEQAVGLAKQFIREAIRTAPGLGRGHGPINHYQAAQLFTQTSRDTKLRTTK